MTTDTSESIREDVNRNVFFAAPADDPRSRRPVDVAILVGSLIVMALTGWSHGAPSDVDVWVLEFFSDGVPGWVSGTATIVFLSGTFYVLAMIVGIAIFGRGRLSISRDMVLAEVLAFIAIVAAAYLAGPEFPDLLPEFREPDGSPSFPVARLAMMVAAIRVASPYLSVPMRVVGRRLAIASSLSALVLTYGTVSSVIGGLAAGAAAASAIQLVFGSGAGIPSAARIRSALREAGLETDGVEFLPVQPVGATLVQAQLDGARTLVKVYGRDAADAALAARAWRAIWYRDEGQSVLATSRQLAEHESLLLLACERAGAPTPHLVAWSRASTDDTVLIMDWVEGQRLSQLDEIDDTMLTRLWTMLADLHDAGVAHGGIDRRKIIVGDDGLLLTELASTRILADDDARLADAAQLLVVTAVTAGTERAIAAARSSLGDDRLLSVLSQLQAAALPRELQQDAKSAGIKIKSLRNEVADELGTEAPELTQLQRVSWGSVAMVVLTLFAASSLISSLTDIGFDAIADAMSNANWAWVVVALVLAQLTNIGEYFSLLGVVGFRIPFGPTIMFRYALSFISLAVPSDAGAIAMNIRYQEKLGVPASAAIAQGPLLTIVSKGFDVILLLLSARFIEEAIDTGEIDFSGALNLIVVIVVAAIVAVVTVLAVPKLRERMMPHVREGFGAVKGSLTDPERLLKVMGGTLMQKILFALTLAASAAAFGASVSFGEAVFVNSAVSLFIGLIPVPGGVGVGEAALTAGLIAVGVPEPVAFPAALTHRMVTSYLPPVFGWWTSRWLAERDYL